MTTQLTPEQQKSNLDAYAAAMRGEPFEFFNINSLSWQPKLDNRSLHDGVLYRPLPKPVTRNWTMADVPLPCWIKREGDTSLRIPTIICPIGIWIQDGSSTYLRDWATLAREYFYTTDGKTFAPCQVTDPAP